MLFKRYSLELPFSAMASLTCPAATEDGTPKRDGGSERVRAAEECALSAYFPFVPRSLPTPGTKSYPALPYHSNYLFRPLQLLNLNEPIRVAQLKLPVVA